MKVPILDLKAQYATIKDEVMQAISKVCESQILCLGPAVEEFEKNTADFCGCKHAIAVSSGTDALLVSLMALGIGDGDEVITTTFTFFATAGSVVRVGAKPVFVDIDKDSCNIDPNLIEEKTTKKTKAVIPVHLFGQIAQMTPINDIAERYNLAVIEDACQAVGAEQEEIKAGNFGSLGCFSFYPSKTLGAFGDAGMVITSDDKLAQKVRLMRTHGQDPVYFYKMIGGNFRLDAIQGAVLNVKLKYLDKWNEKRREIAAYYDKMFSGSEVESPKIEPNNISTYNYYTIKTSKRDQLKEFLAQRGVGTAIFYPQPLHLQECFRQLGYKQGDFPIAEKTCKEVLSLPIYPEMSREQVEYVAKNVLEFYNL